MIYHLIIIYSLQPKLLTIVVFVEQSLKRDETALPSLGFNRIQYLEPLMTLTEVYSKILPITHAQKQPIL